MSKYQKLWETVQKSGKEMLKLSFDEIRDIADIEIDLLFFNTKKNFPLTAMK